MFCVTKRYAFVRAPKAQNCALVQGPKNQNWIFVRKTLQKPKALQGNKAQIWTLLIAKADRKKAEALATPSKLKFEPAKNQRLEKQKKYRRDSRRYSGQFDFVLEAAEKGVSLIDTH